MGARGTVVGAGTKTFGELFPVLAGSPQGILWPEASRRLTNVLRGQGNPSWREIATLTPDALVHATGWRNFGHKCLVELVERAYQLANKVEAAPRVRGRDPIRIAIGDAVAEVAVWGGDEQDAMTVGEALQLVDSLGHEEVPEPVLSAYSWLMAVTVGEFTSERLGNSGLASGVDFVLGALDSRALEIVTARQLDPRVKERPTLEDLATRHGVTRERIRQIEKDGAGRLSKRLSQTHAGVVRRLSQRVARTIGVAVPASQGLSELARLADVDGKPEDHNLITLWLLLWSGGRYKIESGWLVRGGFDRLVLETSQTLSSLGSGDPSSWSEAIDALGAHGFRSPEVAEKWLGELKGFHKFDNYLVEWNRSAADRAEQVLKIQSEPMSREQLSQVVGVEPSTMGNSLLTDPRFTRLDRDAFGLSDWGGDAYIGIVGLIEREIDANDGQVGVAALADRISGEFSVARSSVVAYATNHTSFVTRKGIVRRREPDEDIGELREIRSEARCYRLPGGWAWRRLVDNHVLRGSGLPIPQGFAVEAGLRPGESAERSSEYGPVAVSWIGLHPTIGSIRAPAQRLGARNGDWMFVQLVEGDSVRFSALTADSCSQVESGTQRLNLFVGDGLDLSSDVTLLDSLGEVLAAESRLESFNQAASLLRSRGEADLAELLAGNYEADSTTSLLGLLGFEV